MTDHSSAIAQFDAAIAEAQTAQAAYAALQTLVQTTIGARLFTVMTVDMANEQSRRAHTSDPENYPSSGTKPLNYGPWFDVIHKQRTFFVANTIEDIAKVFFDHELINSLGCQSVVNMPVVIGGTLVATVNMLDVEGHYTAERIQMLRDLIAIPAKLAVKIAQG